MKSNIEINKVTKHKDIVNINKDINSNVEKEEEEKGEKEKKEEQKFYVYLIVTDINNNAYIGATYNLRQRIKKHNRTLVGGAKKTTKYVLLGEKWSLCKYISGFPSWNAALQFEWKWQKLSKTLAKTQRMRMQIKHCIATLPILMALEKSTKSAIPFKDWPMPPIIHYSLDDLDVLDADLDDIDDINDEQKMK